MGFILTSILLAKSGLATGDIGLYETLFFIATTVSYFWLNGFMQGFLVFVPSVALRDRSAAFFNIVLLFNVLSVFIFVCLFFFPSRVAFVFTGGSGLSYLDLFSIYLLFGLPPFVLESFLDCGRACSSYIIFFCSIAFTFTFGDCVSFMVWRRF